MTDIDALIDAFVNDPSVEKCNGLIEGMFNALTAERAKVAALEVEVKFWQERVHRAALTAYTAAREEPHD